eukprot:TRINITY_DN54083_c0_g1_i1.p1 TRINITY_DN54083_c0_g1~~TRINITY_DN54083_c0_g1_i1.p1  ORF type:complete len:622 (+),score=182.07 TRINITY_DN54083_c0_g1_i1:91-1956(+)
MVDQASAQYLHDNIAPVLAKALAEMSTQQPRDGVDFLARWLEVHAQQEKVSVLRGLEEEKLAEERAAHQAEQADLEQKRKAKEEAKAKLEQTYTSLLEQLNNPETKFQDTVWQELVETVKVWMAPEAVQLGIQDEGLDGIEGQVLQYDYISKGANWIEEGVEAKETSMIDKLLQKGTGVTWGALEDTPEGGFPPEAFRPDAKDVAEDAVAKYLWQPQEEVEAQKARDAAEDPSGLPEVERLPNYPVYIECVTDVAPVHYFNMTKLGSYLAVPLVYKSYYTGGALQEAKDFWLEKKRLESEAAKALEEARAAAEAAGEEPPESLPADPEAEEKKMVLTPTPVKRVLCIDTLGTNVAIDKSKIPLLLALCKACADCKSRTEIEQVEAQAKEQIDAEAAQALEADLEAIRTDVAETTDTECKDLMAAAEEEGEEKKKLAQARVAYMQACKLALAAKDKILALKSWVFADEKVNEIVAATLFFFGATKEKLYPKRKIGLQWEKLKTLLNDELFATIQKQELGDSSLFVGEKKGIPEEHTLKYLMDLLTRPAPPCADGAEEEKVREISPALAVLFALVKAALVYRREEVACRKALYLKEKAAKEEAEEAFDVTPPWELDDDCEEGA